MESSALPGRGERRKGVGDPGHSDLSPALVSGSTLVSSVPSSPLLSSRLLPSFCFLVPDLATMLGQERMVSVCFHCLPQLNLGFFLFLYESRCEKGWLEGNTKLQIHKGKECWWAQG